MNELTGIYSTLKRPDLELLQDIERGMPITADLSRSDLLLVYPRNDEEVMVIAQAKPHSISSLYDANLVNQTLTSKDAPAILNAWQRRRHLRVQRELIPSGAPIVQDVYPIYGRDDRLLALLSFETSLIQLERHRQRHVSFRHAVEWLKWMCMHGELAQAENLSPFGEWDGVMMVDTQRRITYLSGIANNLYRRLGYMEDMRGKRLPFLNTSDNEMVLAAFNSRKPLEREVHEGSYIWVRKVLPVWASPSLAGWQRRFWRRQGSAREIGGALIMVHDATEDHRKEQELNVKTTMIQEVHHRVKNNLQTIAAMLRMQARRAKNQETLQTLNEAVTRILSIAVIHEFLSLEETQSINMREVCQRLINQNQQVMTSGKQITFSVEGPAVYLPSQQATACTLAVNELLQNAVEHGFGAQERGQIQLILAESDESVRLEICDDGTPLPEDFNLDIPSSLGLQIVRALVQDDLHGWLKLEDSAYGVRAVIEFPKLASK